MAKPSDDVVEEPLGLKFVAKDKVEFCARTREDDLSQEIPETLF